MKAKKILSLLKNQNKSNKIASITAEEEIVQYFIKRFSTVGGKSLENKSDLTIDNAKIKYDTLFTGEKDTSRSELKTIIHKYSEQLKTFFSHTSNTETYAYFTFFWQTKTTKFKRIAPSSISGLLLISIYPAYQVTKQRFFVELNVEFSSDLRNFFREMIYTDSQEDLSLTINDIVIEVKNHIDVLIKAIRLTNIQ